MMMPLWSILLVTIPASLILRGYTGNSLTYILGYNLVLAAIIFSVYGIEKIRGKEWEL